MTRGAARDGRPNWQSVRHYAYVDRPYEAAWTKLAEVPHEVFGARPGVDEGSGDADLRAHAGGVEVDRTVTIRFGGLVCEPEMARMALRWQDSRHAALFPVFEGILSLAPVLAGQRHLTQVGLVGRYRPPLGAAGAVVNRIAGAPVAEEAIAGFADGVARRLGSMVAPEPAGPGHPEIVEDEGVSPGNARILVTMDGLAERRGGAVGVGRQLASTPGVTHAEINPLIGLATIEYDPEACSLARILAELEVDVPPA